MNISRMHIAFITLLGCTQPKGSVLLDVCPEEDCEEDSGDINEDSGSVYEDSAVEEPETTVEPEEDLDGDGYTEEDGDCDDSDPEVSPAGNDEDVDGIDPVSYTHLTLPTN